MGDDDRNADETDDPSRRGSRIVSALDSADLATQLVGVAQFAVGVVSLLYLRDIYRRSAETGSPPDGQSGSDRGEAPARQTFESIVGTAPETHDRLDSIGIETIDGLAVADPVALAERTGVPVARTAQWVTEARVRRRTDAPDARPDGAGPPAVAGGADPGRPSSPTASDPPPTDGEGTTARRDPDRRPSERRGTRGEAGRGTPDSRDGSRQPGVGPARRGVAEQPTEDEATGRRRAGSRTDDGRTERAGGARPGTTADAAERPRDASSGDRRSREREFDRTRPSETGDGEENEEPGRLAELFESDWQVAAGTFVVAWAIAAGLYGAGDVVTTWYALETGFTTETNPIMSAAYSIHPAAMIVVKAAIVGGLYKFSRTLVFDNELSLDDQIALAIPLTLGVVGAYATLVNLQNLPGSMIVYVVLSIVFIGISGAAAVAFYEGIPLTVDEVQEYDLGQELNRSESDGADATEPRSPTGRARVARRFGPTPRRSVGRFQRRGDGGASPSSRSARATEEGRTETGRRATPGERARTRERDTGGPLDRTRANRLDDASPGDQGR